MARFSKAEVQKAVRSMKPGGLRDVDAEAYEVSEPTVFASFDAFNRKSSGDDELARKAQDLFVLHHPSPPYFPGEGAEARRTGDEVVVVFFRKGSVGLVRCEHAFTIPREAE